MGWTKAMTRQALADCRRGGGRAGRRARLGRRERRGPPETPEPWVAVLPGLDPTTMGWKQRDWYLPEAATESFDRAGNGGPTLWVDGRIVGVWAQTRDGEMPHPLLREGGG